MSFTDLKNKLVDVEGSKKNMLSLYFPGISPESTQENIENALGHWPENAITMIGLKGLNNVEFILNQIISNKITGDILEAGVWRGGASIFIKKILQENKENRKLFVCDSFEGLPIPQNDRFNHKLELTDNHYLKNSYLGVSLEEVQKNFEEYKALDENVIFLKGWFKDTLGDKRINKLSLLRMDGDMYSSTMDILNNLLDKVVQGGYVIIDDYGLDCCKAAIHDYFKTKSIDIKSKIKMVNHCIGYFQKDF